MSRAFIFLLARGCAGGIVGWLLRSAPPSLSRWTQSLGKGGGRAFSLNLIHPRSRQRRDRGDLAQETLNKNELRQFILHKMILRQNHFSLNPEPAVPQILWPRRHEKSAAAGIDFCAAAACCALTTNHVIAVAVSSSCLRAFVANPSASTLNPVTGGIVGVSSAFSIKRPTELVSVDAEIGKGRRGAFSLNLIHPRRKVVGV